jgi:hypothetical protein
MSGARRRLLRRSLPVGAAGILMAALAACSGVGGGYLPPDATAGFSGQGSFGFTFSCQDRGGSNRQPGKLSIQLEYLEHGSSLMGGPFSVHGIVDQIDPVVESGLCIGKNPPPGGNELTFLGRYQPTSGALPGQLSTCPSRETKSTPLCRFEVTVRDNDGNLAPSKGDFFSIQLSGDTRVCNGPNLDSAACSVLLGPVVYVRAGVLAGGNITVK